MLVELAIADAYGSCFELSEEDFVQEYNNLEYLNHEKHLSLIRTGCYTDDTQMTIAIAECLLSGEDWTPLNLADRFVRCFRRDERRGYAGSFYHFLLETYSGKEFLENIHPTSERSGAAMRSSPLGLLSDIEEIRSKCYIQANTTHDTDAGRDTSFAAAMMVYYFKNDIGPQNKLSKWLAEMLNSPQIERPWRGPTVSTLGWQCVHAAMTSAMEEKTLSDVLKRSIAFTGDVDTVATIAVSAASWSKEIEQNLPQRLYDQLENGRYGRDYLADLDRQLKAKYK